MRVLLTAIVAAVAVGLADASLAIAQPSSRPSRPPEPRPPAESPTPPAQDPPRLDETVEVTAARGTIETEKSPASSTVVLRKDIEARRLITVDQALTVVEGVYAYRQRGVPDNEVGIGMRGFSGRGTGQARVLVLLDGQPLNNAYTGAVDWTAIPLEEVDRVEVVRGPFSSLYGGNAMGGVVNVMTRPIDRRSAEVSAQYGTHGTAAYSGRVGARFFERLGLAVSSDLLRTDGYRAQEVLRTATDSTPNDGVPVTGLLPHLTRTGTESYAVGLRGENTYDRYGIRARAEYTFAPATFGSIQYVRQSSSYGWDAYETWVRTADGAAVDNGDLVFQHGEAWKRVSLTPANYLGVIGGSASNLYQAQLLQSGSGRGQLRVQGGILHAPRSWSSAPGATATLLGGPGTYTHQQNRGAFAHAQWSASAGTRHTLALGTDARFDRATITVSPVADYLEQAGLSPRDTYTAGHARTLALYAQDQIAVSDRLQLTLGGRYDHWRTYDGESQPAPGTATSSFPGRSGGALTAKAAVLFRVYEGTVLRSSLGTAFRSPSVFDLYRDLRLSSGQLLLGNADLDPERMTSWEVGVRQSAGPVASLDVTYYQNRIRDLIFRSVDLVVDPEGRTSRMMNAGRARTDGLEVGVHLRPAAWLTLRPTYTFTDAVITENAASPASVGKQIPFVPRHTAAATASAVYRAVAVTTTGRFQTAVFATDTNIDTTKGVPGSYDELFEVDLAVNLQATRRLGIQVAVENLLDRQYYMFYRSPGRVVMAGLRLRY